MARSRLVRWGYPLLGVALFLLYLPTLAPGATFTDGPELVTAVVSLGVAHPTGYPVFILVGHAFCKLLPLPLLACVKIEIFNALCAAAAAVLAARATRDLALLGRAARSRPLDADAGGLAAGLMLGIAPLVWEEVRIPEVYALHLFLVAWAGHAWMRFEVTRRRAWVIGAALPMGIGLAHHVTMVYMLPAAFLYLMVRRPSFFVSWGFPAACAVGFLPLLSYAFLIWANRHTTGVAWGDVDGWSRLYDHFTGRQYQSFMHSLDRAGHVARLRQIAPLFDAQFLPQGTVLFFAGLFFALRSAWRPALFFLAYLIFNVAHGVHYGVGDYGAYYIPAVYACAVILGVGLAGLAGLARGVDRVDRLPGPVPAALLPAILIAGLGVSLVPVARARSRDFAGRRTLAESYGAEVAQGLPPGAVFMTQGDGFLFTMWYENHVWGRATDVATVDVGNIHTAWFQRYLVSHTPLACDPRSPAVALDPAGYARRCDTYRKRMDLRSPDSWVSIGLAGNRRRYATSASPAPVLRGADPRCAEKAWHDPHAAKECRCWGYGKSAGAVEGMLEEDCVDSAEEGGVVPRDPAEIFAQRIIEDMLDERPVFERNVLTQWAGSAGNPRGWDGPTYQRVSADYALVGRGRFNEIVRSGQIQGLDACGETFQPIPARAYRPPRAEPAGQERRRPYLPNPRPTLLQASYLVTTPEGRDDEATREIPAGEPVYLHVDWFERFSWDGAQADRHGKPIRHGVRVCVFDPQGRRVAARAIRSGATAPVALLDRGAAREVGTYHVAACSVGEVGDEPLPLGEERRCAWTLLEYAFSVR